MDRSVNPADAAVHAPPGGRKILIVDDQPAVLKVLRTSLECHGYIVCGEADNGIDAIGRAVATRPDLVILDVAMPGLNGLEVASILQRLLPHVPMILHTIYGDHVGKAFGAVFGIRAIVAKTDGINKLIDCVHSVLKGAPNPDQP
jgi:two-component system, NarL family, response regulator EvgA